MNIGILQFSPVWGDKEKNLFYIEQELQKIKEMPEIIVLPEMFEAGFLAIKPEEAEDINGKVVEKIKSLSKQFNTCICGSLAIKNGRKTYNQIIAVQPDGKISTYNKRHLFSIGGENNFYSEGNERVIWHINGFRILPLICYDLRFPVWSRNQNDYDLIIISANWPAARHYVWDILVKARAIENQTYVVAANRTGADINGTKHMGGSFIINYKGTEIVTMGEKPAFASTEIDLKKINEFREKFPVWKDADNFQIR
jgi:omega-amidase